MSLLLLRNPKPVAVPVFLSAAISLLSLAGCSSTNSSPRRAPELSSTQATSTPAAANDNAKPETPDPCKLLTKDEAAEVLGEPVHDAQGGNLGDTKYCDYKAIKLYGGIMPASVHIALAPEKRNTWDIGKQMHMKSDPKETKQVDGLGEDAYYEGESLVIFDKDLFITVEVSKNFDKPDHHKVIMDAMRQVAEKIVPRL